MKNILLYSHIPDVGIEKVFYKLKDKRIKYRLLVEKELKDVSSLEQIADLLITSSWKVAKENRKLLDTFIFNSLSEFLYHAKKEDKSYLIITNDKFLYEDLSDDNSVFVKNSVSEILKTSKKDEIENALKTLIENIKSAHKKELYYISLLGNEVLFLESDFTPFSSFFKLAEWRYSYDGILIVFEGIDGSGKTTQCELVYNFLLNSGRRVIKMREPSESEYGKIIREKMKYENSLSPEEEYQLFLKDREVHFREEILPALKKGFIVLLDRYYHSTYAYQKAKGIPEERIIEDNMRISAQPDLVFIFDIFVGEALRRIEKTRDFKNKLFEKRDYLIKVRENYFDFSGKGVYFVSAEQSVESIYEFVIRKIEEKIHEKERNKASF